MTNLNADFFSQPEIERMPFRSCGQNVSIHRRVIIVNIENVALGSNVRVDADVSLLASGPMDIGSYVHVGQGCYLAGKGGITLGDFSGLSQGVKIYSASDDYSGAHLTNPTIPAKFLGLNVLPVSIGRHAIIGAGSVILPGANVGEGCSVGALSLVSRPVDPWGIYVGSPVRRVGERKKDLLAAEAQLMPGALGHA